MSYLNRVWAAASVAVVNGTSDQGCKLKSSLKSLHHSQKRFSSAGSGGNQIDFRPLAALLESDVVGILGNSNRADRTKQTDESIKQAMYMNCWGRAKALSREINGIIANLRWLMIDDFGAETESAELTQKR